jgi:alkylhydroperoxidase family enzyme
MPRIPEITDAGDDPTLQRAFAKEREINGDLLNPTKVLAHCPQILEATKQFYASFPKSGLIPATLHALVHTRVAAINGCPF